MGFMDKAREAVQQATTVAQQGLASGQAKVDDLSHRRAFDALTRDLGAAFFAEQRTGGSREDVLRALAAVDAHVAANGMPAAEPAAGFGTPATGAAGTAGTAGAAGPATPPPAGAPTAGPTAPEAAAGGFSLDDL